MKKKLNTQELRSFYKEIFQLNRSLLGPANNEALRKIGSFLPIKTHLFPSGAKVLDWKIPQEWQCHSAVLRDETTNKIILTAQDTILHVVNYSQPFEGKVSYGQLISHLHFVKKSPDAIPYRTSYYSDNWGLCLSYAQFLKLNPDHEYYVEIDTSFKNGHLAIGEATLPGKLKKEVILTSYLCHPQQAHDGLSGVVLLIMLYHLLRGTRTKFTYRFFFIPETIGSIALLATHQLRPQNIEYALVATCVGAGNTINYKQTYLGNHTLDHVVKNALKRKKYPYRVRPYWPQGSDERQLSSPSVRIPTGSLMGNVYQEYPEYHTSADNLSYVQWQKIKMFANLYQQIIREYERSPKLQTTMKGGEPFLTKHKLYRSLGIPGHNKAEIIRSWVLFLADGAHTIQDIAAYSGFTENELAPYVKELTQAKLIRTQ